MMRPDNELYNQFGDTWWDEDQTLNILLTWFGPARFKYFQQMLAQEQKESPKQLQLLDVGCGGGLLSEDFARLGYQVTGIDPSEPSVATARKHAQQEGLSIDYRVGVGEYIPFPDNSFDIITCCDVIEHVDSVSQTLQEIARVLRPGGIMLYDTLNRTWLSWLVYIKIAQDWKMTRLATADFHEWKRFVKPSELLAFMQSVHLQNRGLTGLKPRISPAIIGPFLRYKRGALSLKDLGKRVDFHESPDLSVSYMGYAVKQPANPQ